MHQESNELNPKTKKIISCISIVLFLFIMLLNATLNFFLKRNKEG